MSIIPLHLQRRFEQRWAAKLARSVASVAPKSISLKRAVQNSPRPAKAKEKPRVEFSGLSRVVSADLSPASAAGDVPPAVAGCASGAIDAAAS
jgi:hypothetical protein